MGINTLKLAIMPLEKTESAAACVLGRTAPEFFQEGGLDHA
jgi:hypothetical protein